MEAHVWLICALVFFQLTAYILVGFYGGVCVLALGPLNLLYLPWNALILLSLSPTCMSFLQGSA